MKCSDICNQARPFDVAREWSFRVVTEFFLQGDAELAQGLPISPMMDRKSTDALKMQCNFIDFVVRPLFDLLAKAFNREPTIQVSCSIRNRFSSPCILCQRNERGGERELAIANA